MPKGLYSAGVLLLVVCAVSFFGRATEESFLLWKLGIPEMRSESI